MSKTIADVPGDAFTLTREDDGTYTICVNSNLMEDIRIALFVDLENVRLTENCDHYDALPERYQPVHRLWNAIHDLTKGV